MAPFIADRNGVRLLSAVVPVGTLVTVLALVLALVLNVKSGSDPSSVER